MALPRVLILRAPGTNCDEETAFAFEQAGARVDVIHLNRLLDQPARLEHFQILCIPGGFSYGDDVSAGRIFANQMRHHVSESLQEFKASGKLILGICNGFQVLIKSGLLLDSDGSSGEPATLAWNDTGRFVDRWVNLSTAGGNCVFLSGIDSLYLPVAHAEGRFVARDDAALSRLEDAGQLALRYADSSGAVRADITVSDNPNGSVADVAGICDTTGRVFGLMPHPERHIDRTHHPRWTRGEAPEKADGLRLFENAVKYFAA